uniref:Uncharacterized protein n=1 Tax=Vibrio parahaemolyticus TaxID=670 RepID=A0A7M1W6D3_VIBPH|nr:hypothetical protein VP287_00006 [Vibrio parahaemolyticus]
MHGLAQNGKRKGLRRVLFMVSIILTDEKLIGCQRLKTRHTKGRVE